eukprot:879975-Pyramimonas_sp.AAC.1
MLAMKRLVMMVVVMVMMMTIDVDDDADDDDGVDADDDHDCDDADDDEEEEDPCKPKSHSLTMLELILPPSSLFISPYSGSCPLRGLPRWKTPLKTLKHAKTLLSRF